MPSEHPGKSSNPHDSIEFFSKSILAIFLRAAPLYAQNRSLRQLEKLLKIPKTTIRKALLEHNVELRMPASDLKSGHHSYSTATTPFGYQWTGNRLQRDEKEFPIVQEILKLRQSNKSFRAIASILNAKKIFTRKKNQWHHEGIRTVIERSKKLKI
jgi:hypothetical protein